MLSENLTKISKLTLFKCDFLTNKENCVKTDEFRQGGQTMSEICYDDTENVNDNVRLLNFLRESFKRWNDEPKKFYNKENSIPVKELQKIMEKKRLNVANYAKMHRADAIAFGCAVAKENRIVQSNSKKCLLIICTYSAGINWNQFKNYIDQHETSAYEPNFKDIKEHKHLIAEHKFENFIYYNEALYNGQLTDVLKHNGESALIHDKSKIENNEIPNNFYFRLLSTMHSLDLLKESWDYYCSLNFTIDRREIPNFMCNRPDVG